MATTDRNRSAAGWPPVWYWMKVAAGVALVYAAARIVVAVGSVLILLLVAFILGIGFQPAVSWLMKRGITRGWAVAIIFLSGIAVVGGFLALALPVIIRELGGLITAAPDYLERLQRESAWFRDLDQRFDLIGKLQAAGRELPGTALGFVASLTALLFNTITVGILTIYFTGAMPRIRRAVTRVLEPDDRQEFEAILDESVHRVGGYVLGNLFISLIAGISSFLVLFLLGVPYAAILGFFVALTDLIPTIGAIIGAAVAVIVAAFTGVPQLIGTAVWFLVYQQVENYLIQPRVMRHAIQMSAASVIVAVLIGGSLAGVVGALLALPVAAIIKVVLNELYLEDRIETVRSHERPVAPPVGGGKRSTGRRGTRAKASGSRKPTGSRKAAGRTRAGARTATSGGS